MRIDRGASLRDHWLKSAIYSRRLTARRMGEDAT
jgi:hypothetical protein